MWSKTKLNLQKILPEIVVLAFMLGVSYFLVRPLVGPGFFPMHDDTQIARVVAMGRAIREGQFPVRWVFDLGFGYGYPLFNFYGPLPYYFGGFLYALGFSGLVATKMTMLVGMLLPILGLYLALRKILGRASALVAGIFLGFAPYHAVQLYVRGAVGETWALGFLPFLVWSLTQMRFSRKLGSLYWLIGLSGVILSHTILGYVTVGFVVLGLIISRLVMTMTTREESLGKYWSSLFWATLTALGVTIWFWLPAMIEMSFTSVAGQISATANWRDHFVCLPQLWDSLWGFAGSAAGCLDGLSFKLGKLHIISAVTSIIIFWKFSKRLRSVAIYATLLTLVAIWLMTSWSTPVWQFIPGFSYIQYPWRFLTFAILGLSLLSGMWLSLVPTRLLRVVTSIGLLILLVAASSKLFIGQWTVERGAGEYESQEELRFRSSRVSSEYLPIEMRLPTEASEIVRDTISKSEEITTLDVVKETAVYGKYWIQTQKPVVLLIKRAYFPGWKYFWNSKEIIPQVESGLPRVSLPHGEGTLEIKFTDTPVRTVANLLSLVVLVIMIYKYGKISHS